ncbi:MAG: hypothetical protein L0170_13410 [Acidobacteria bacterium]|nr:hypothetical protein [Acidobacteriota bacterium]
MISRPGGIWILLLLLTTGCAGPNPEAGRQQVGDIVEERTGASLAWNASGGPLIGARRSFASPTR